MNNPPFPLPHDPLSDIDTRLDGISIGTSCLQDLLLDERIQSRNPSTIMTRQMNREIARFDIDDVVGNLCLQLDLQESITVKDLLDLAQETPTSFMVTQSVENEAEQPENDDVTTCITSILKQFSNAFFSAHPEITKNLQPEHVISRLKERYLPQLYRLFGVEASAVLLERRK